MSLLFLVRFRACSVSRFTLDCKINRNYSPAIRGDYRDFRFLLITSYVSASNMKFIPLIFILIFSSTSSADTEPSSINWLPPEFSKKLEKEGCEIPYEVKWAGDVTLKANGLIVGQFAAPGQYDIAAICANRILIHWGGPKACASETSNRGESIEVPSEEEIHRYLSRYNNDTWPSELSHSPLGMYIFGKSSFYQYCFNGEWLIADGAD